VEIARPRTARGLGLHDSSGDPPAYMQARNTLAFPDFNGWHSGRTLQAALDARGQR